MIKILHVVNGEDTVGYRRTMLGSLINSDQRFEYKSVDGAIHRSPEIYENLIEAFSSTDIDIILCSVPFFITGGLDPCMARLKEDNVFVVYDLSDNWPKVGDLDRSKNLLEVADFCGCSSRYLYSVASQICPNTGLYLNGCRYHGQIEYPDVKSGAKYVYSGQLSKLAFEAIDRISVLDPEESIDIYPVNNSDIERYKAMIPSNVTVKDAVPHDALMGILPSYQIALCTFQPDDKTKYGMLPLKFFDYCQAHLPTIYSNCTELAHEDFRKTAFDLYADGFSLDAVHSSSEDFDDVCSKYNMMASLMAFKEGIFEAYEHRQS